MALEDHRDRAFSYPYRQITGPILCWPNMAREETTAMPVLRSGQWFAKSGQALGERMLLLAAGSNGSPDQLARKFAGLADPDPIILMPVDVADIVPVYSAHITAYGAVAGTLMRMPGAVSRLTALLVTPAQLAIIDGSEALGVNYQRVALSLVLQPFPAMDVAIYRSIRGCFAPAGEPLVLSAFAAQGLTCPSISERQALALAADCYGFQGEVEEFVDRLVADANNRRAVTETMRCHAIIDGLGCCAVSAAYGHLSGGRRLGPGDSRD